MQGDIHRKIIEGSSYIYAYIKTVTDGTGTPVDFEFIEVNAAFTSLFSLQKEHLIGKRVTDIFPRILQDGFDWITVLGRVGLTGKDQDFVQRVPQADTWFRIHAMSPEQGFVALQAERLLLQESMLSCTPALLCVLNFAGKFLLVSDEWSRVFGYEKITLLDSNIMDYLHDHDREVTKTSLALLHQEGVSHKFINRFRHLDGSYRTLAWQVYVSKGLMYGTAKDTTKRSQNEEVKQSELEIMNLFFEQALTGLCMFLLDAPVDWDQASDKKSMVDYIMQHQRIVRTNDAFLKMYKTTKEQILKMTVAEFFKHDPSAARKLWRNLLDSGRVRMESEARRLDGSLLWVMGDYSTLYDSKGRITGHFGMQLDISERKKSEIALAHSEQRYRLITEHASDVIWVYDVKKKCFNYISHSVFNFMGYMPDDIISLSYSELIHPEDCEKVRKTLRTMIKEFRRNPELKRDWKFQARHIKRDKSIAWADSSINFRFGDTENIEVIGVSRDVTEHKLYEEQILHLSYRDQLTGLYNRRYFTRQQSTRFATENVLPLSLVVCDVNGLKLTNDVFGHHAGDELLKACADCLRVVKESDDMIARVGGDEFVMVFPSTSQEEVQTKIKAVQHKISLCKIGKTKLSVSFGFATMDSLHKPFTNLYEEAEDVMYRRKLLESSSYKQEVISLLADRLHEKGEFERSHSEHVATLAYAVGEAMGLPPDDLKELRLGGLLHDIGKIGIEGELLQRQGPLSTHEWAQMRRHPEVGFHILRSVQNFGRIADWILMHHERPDGKGYPQGLKDSSIPLQAKIISVADAFDSMTNISGYHVPLDTDSALKELLLHAGTQFDRAVVQVFLELPLNRITSIRR